LKIFIHRNMVDSI